MLRCLIVEDNTLERRALEKLFEMCFPTKFGYIASVMDGKTAMKMMASSTFDLVVLDINLPDIQGTEILHEINIRYPDTKVIMATAYSDYDHMRASVKDNAFDYLLKPYSIETFRDAVSAYLLSVESDSFGTLSAVGTVKKYIEENYMNDISLDDIASRAGFDKSYIGRVFKKSEGMTIMTYLLNWRINRAEALLKKGMNVSEACYSVGFRDPAYFSKCFKKVKGYSPSSGR